MNNSKALVISLFIGCAALFGCSPDFYAEQALDAIKESEEKARWDRLEQSLNTPKVFSEDDFPQKSCGDNAPNSFPAVRYRVLIPASDVNVQKVQQNFCEDAWLNSQANTIVVASFSEQSLDYAHNLKNLLVKYGYSEASVNRTVIDTLKK